MGHLTGWAQAFPGGTSEQYTTPFPIALGTRARDMDGNEFVLCGAAATLYSGQVVTINDENWRATALTTTGRGKVGVVMQGTTAVTDAGSRAIWVQVYGRVLMQVGGSVVSPSDAANGPTTANDSTATVFALPTSATTPAGVPYPVSDVSTAAIRIDGITVATGASVADVSGHAGQGGVQKRETTPAVTAVTSAASFIGSSIYVFLNYPTIVMHGADGNAAT